MTTNVIIIAIIIIIMKSILLILAKDCARNSKKLMTFYLYVFIIRCEVNAVHVE